MELIDKQCFKDLYFFLNEMKYLTIIHGNTRAAYILMSRLWKNNYFQNNLRCTW